ncbi:MAG: hypothetical protein KDA54_10140, partial [Phycisphaerales bacterium]|nr:hypothetical protein [Phycisphaerales bacterium]
GPTGSGSEIIGATTMNLTIDNPGSSDAGMYDVVVSNVCGSTVSSVAELTIRIPPEIPTHWQAVSIHPGWAQMSSRAMGIGGGRIGGDAVTPTILPDGRTFDLAHPVVWDTNTLVGIDATPPGSIGGGINDVEGDLLGGWFWHTWNCPSGGQTWTCAWQSAGFWTAPSLNFAEASHSSGAEYDYIYATDGERLVGTLVYEYQMGNYDSKAHLWTAENNGISLHFTGATDTTATAIDGEHQYGWYRTASSSTHAIMWSGTSSSGVDLHPTGYGTSVISGAGDGQAVGTADSNAGLWVKTAGAFINLNPQGATSSAAVATHGGLQAGNVAGRAALWAGTPASYVDLGAFVPSGFTSSYAEDFEVAMNGTITVVGYGYNPQAGRNEALVWRSIGVPGDCDGDGDVDLDDHADFIACLSGPSGGMNAGCTCFDFNLDGDTDLRDFADFQMAFTGN